VHCDVGSGNKARGLLFGLFIPKENEHGVSELATMVHMGYDEIPHGHLDGVSCMGTGGTSSFALKDMGGH
jgi:hypothetical protein